MVRLQANLVRTKIPSLIQFFGLTVHIVLSACVQILIVSCKVLLYVLIVVEHKVWHITGFNVKEKALDCCRKLCVAASFKWHVKEIMLAKSNDDTILTLCIGILRINLGFFKSNSYNNTKYIRICIDKIKPLLQPLPVKHEQAHLLQHYNWSISQWLRVRPCHLGNVHARTTFLSVAAVQQH